MNLDTLRHRLRAARTKKRRERLRRLSCQPDGWTERTGEKEHNPQRRRVCYRVDHGVPPLGAPGQSEKKVSHSKDAYAQDSPDNVA